MNTAPPPAARALETCLYVDDLARSREFYERVFGFGIIAFTENRICAMNAGGSHVLILFVRGSCAAPLEIHSGTIPGHDGAGPVHIGFAIAAEDLSAWEAHLASLGIPIEGRVRWPRGAASLYFRDPDRHLLEIATPGIWSIY